MVELDQHSFTLKARPGHMHDAADALSRSNSPIIAPVLTTGGTLSGEKMPTVAELIQSQSEDAYCTKRMDELQECLPNTTSQFSLNVDGALCQLKF